MAFPQNKITFRFDYSVKATAGTRTQDLSFTKASLYQLSYGGIQQITVAEINIFLIDFIDDYARIIPAPIGTAKCWKKWL